MAVHSQHLGELEVRSRVKAARTLIKINAHISQVDGMFGTVYNTQV